MFTQNNPASADCLYQIRQQPRFGLRVRQPLPADPPRTDRLPEVHFACRERWGYTVACSQLHHIRAQLNYLLLYGVGVHKLDVVVTVSNLAIRERAGLLEGVELRGSTALTTILLHRCDFLLALRFAAHAACVFSVHVYSVTSRRSDNS
jgi:hypothetical protein